jgi:ubiquinone biosynthesis protein
VRLGIADYLERPLQVAAAVLRVCAVAVARRLRGRPVEGPLLVREGMERLSGSFIKFGQILSLQIDSLPRAYCDSLLALLDRVPPFPPEQVDEVFRAEFNAPPTSLFAEFEYRPVASASIGQVHRAVLKDGTRVAVKVQRPGIRRKFEHDVMLLGIGVKLIFLLRLRRFYFMRDPVRELSTWTQDELDYRREAANCQLLSDNAVQTPSEHVPRIHWPLTRGRVLTMDYLEGPSVASYLRMIEDNDEQGLAQLTAQGFIPATFSSNVISNFLSDAFRFGVFHADLHPANLLILPGNVVGYVDFGIVAVLTPEARRKQIELTLAYSSGNPDAIYEGFLNICKFGADADLPGLRRRIEEFAGQWYQEPALAGKVRFRVSVTKTMMDLLSVCQDYGVLVDREMIKYIRSTVLADGLVQRLAPGFDLAQVLRRVVEEYMAAEARQQVFSRGAAMSLLTDMALWMETGPGALLHALSLLERRQFRIRAALRATPDQQAALRTRTVGVAIVWGVMMVMLGFTTDQALASGQYLFAGLSGGIVAIWTVWLVDLLRRLLAK